MNALVACQAVPAHGADATLAETPRVLARARTFHTLDALRGVAALSIVMFHAAFFVGLAPPAEGQLAVDLFFVMSGFIIAFRYDRNLRAGMRLPSFMAARLVRLYPLYVLGAVLGVLPAIMAIAAGDTDAFHRGMVASFPFHVLMMPTWFVWPRIEELYPFNYVAWSLVLEVLVNVAYAATFRFWTMRRIAILVVLAFVGLCICDACYGGLKYGYAWSHWPCGVVRILYGFPVGVLLYRLFERRPFDIRVSWWLLLLVAVALFWFRTPSDVSWCKPVWELLAVTTLVPLIVVAAVVNEPPRRLQGWCPIAGILSYVLYSLHAPFVSLFIRGEEEFHVDLQSQTFGKGLAFVLLLAALCVAAHLAYDRPVRRFLARRLGRSGVMPSSRLQASAKY